MDKPYTPAMIRVKQAMQLLGVSEATFYRRVKKGHFDIKKRGSCAYVSTEQIEAYLDPSVNEMVG